MEKFYAAAGFGLRDEEYVGMGLLSLPTERQAMVIVIRAVLRMRHLAKTNTYHPPLAF